jgi:hypothetical protein
MLEMLSRNCLLKQKNYTSLIRNELGVSTLMTFLLLRLRSPLLSVYLISEYSSIILMPGSSYLEKVVDPGCCLAGKIDRDLGSGPRFPVVDPGVH